MAKLRHIAIATPDPERSAAFYEKAFGFDRIGELRDHPLADGIFLSDGTVNIALLTFKTDQIGKGLDYVGVHHFGVLVEDPAAATDSLLEAGATKLDIAEGDPDEGGFEIKFRDPDGIVFDIAGTAWLGTSLDD